METNTTASDKEHRALLEEEREARHQIELQQRDAQINVLGQQIQALAQNQAGGNQPRDATADLVQTVRGLKTANDAFTELRTTFAPLPAPPAGNSPWDEAGYLMDRLSSGIKEGLQGAGALAAGQRGIPPELLGMVPPKPDNPGPPAPEGYPRAPGPKVAPPPAPDMSSVNIAAALGGGDAPPSHGTGAPAAPVAGAGPIYTDSQGQVISKEQFDQLHAQGMA